MITPPSANNNDNHNYAHSSPHSPHTAPDPSVNVHPEYSQQHSISSPSSTYQHLDYPSSTTTNSPHTATIQYDSPNPNPQLGHVQLDFIPLPTAQPSAPPQPSTIPLPYVAPPAPLPSVPYPVPPSVITQQQPQHENVTFVDATPIDMSNENYKLSSAAGGSTFIQDLRNPRKKPFWIFNIIVLAIIFGALGATVWKPDNKNTGNNYDTRGTPSSSSSATIPAYSNHVVPTPVGPGVPTSVAPPVVPTPVGPGITSSVAPPVVPTPVVVPTTPVPDVPEPKPTSNPPPPSPPPQPSSGGGNGDYWTCRNACQAVSDKCDANCRATDDAYKSCNAKCSTSSDQFCEYDCRVNNACFRSCLTAWGACSQACG
ncbi:hypothetical protein MVEG_04615 [Podila verticillata NRRL 6337]|nr:hypothetical protein MVEG_04615 [Podila verticillata NRRL 6337]